MAKSANESGAALQHAFDRKIRQSWEACHREGIEFVPLPVETLGGWDSRAIKVIGKLGRQLARHCGKEDSEIISHTFQRLSILLMRGNASLLLSRSPSYIPQHIDGIRES